MSLCGTCRYLWALTSTNLRASMALRASFLMNCAFMALNDLFMFINWWILFHSIDDIGGWRLKDCALLWGIAAFGYGAGVVLCGGASQLSRVIIQGELDSFLTQPRSPLLQVITARSSASGWGDIAAGVGLLYWSGYLEFHALPLLSLVLICGTVVLMATGVIFHALAFWAGDVRDFSNQLWEFLVAFSTYPDPIFSGMLRFALFTVLPAGFIVFLPVRIVQAPQALDLMLLVLAAFTYALLAVCVFERGLRRYESGNAVLVRF